MSSQGRFKVIATYKHHILAYIFVALASLIFLLFKLEWDTIILLIPVGLISILYTLPLFGAKRLRDLHLIKIFLIAFVWAYLGVLPMIIDEVSNHLIRLVFLEKFLFILAITLPFDIRDLGIDGSLMTIPKVIGSRKSYQVAAFALIIGLLTFGLYSSIGHPPLPIQTIVAVFLAYAITAYCIILSRNKSSDYYFSGLLDSTLIIRGLAFASYWLLIL